MTKDEGFTYYRRLARKNPELSDSAAAIFWLHCVTQAPHEYLDRQP